MVAILGRVTQAQSFLGGDRRHLNEVRVPDIMMFERTVQAEGRPRAWGPS